MFDTRQHVILSEAKDPSVPDVASHGFFTAFRMTGKWRCRLLALRSLGEAGPARAASGLVWLYQRTLSPALVALNPTCGCRFAPTCSHYAREALRAHGFLAGLVLTFLRLAKCGPWHPGGEDPVPSSPRPVCTRISSS